MIGQDGKILFIRHGSQLIRVSTCRAIKTDNSKRVTPEDEQKKPDKNNTEDINDRINTESAKHQAAIQGGAVTGPRHTTRSEQIKSISRQ